MSGHETDTPAAKAALLPVKNAREASKRLGLRSMIVMQELPNGQWGFTSYGKTKADCDRALAIAEELLSAVEYAVAVEDGRI
jgi:hypothetical protein